MITPASKYLLLVLLIVCISTGPGLSQSIFSGQGIGEIRSIPGARLEAMGGGGIAFRDSLLLSTINPALPAALSQTRIAISGAYRWINVEDNSTSDQRNYAEFQGVALAFPLYKGWTFSASIDPYSIARAAWYWPREFNEYSYEEQYKVSGGIARGLIGIAFPVTDDLLIGGGTRVLFGSIDQEFTINFHTSLYRDAQYTNSMHSMSVGASLGAAWQFYPEWSLGVTFQSAQSGDGTSEFSYVDSDSVRSIDGTIEFPANVGFGLSGVVYPRVRVIGDVQYTMWDDAQITLDNTLPITDTWRISAGAEYQPILERNESWYNRLYYRLGFFTENHYIENLSGDSSRLIMGSAGIGIPLIGNLRRLDFVFQCGIQGDIEKFGAKESMFRLSITLESSEKWFQPSR